MQQSLITIAYIAASALFTLSLGGLSQQETARRGTRLRDRRHADRARGAEENALMRD